MKKIPGNLAPIANLASGNTTKGGMTLHAIAGFFLATGTAVTAASRPLWYTVIGALIALCMLYIAAKTWLWRQHNKELVAARAEFRRLLAGMQTIPSAYRSGSSLLFAARRLGLVRQLIVLDDDGWQEDSTPGAAPRRSTMVFTVYTVIRGNDGIERKAEGREFTTGDDGEPVLVPAEPPSLRAALRRARETQELVRQTGIGNASTEELREACQLIRDCEPYERAPGEEE